MTKKRWLIALIIVILLGTGGAIFYFTKEDKNTALTVTEKKWIEDHKNNLIDLAIPSDVPVLSSNGEGLIFDFLEALEKNTGLEFNKLSYTSAEEPKSSYEIVVTERPSANDILIYQDNYALVTKTKRLYGDVSEIQNIVVGVLEDDMTKISKYLDGSRDVTYKAYKDVPSMVKDIESDNLDAVVIPRLAYLDEIIKNENLNLAYNITDYTQDYVLKLGGTDRLNKILIKYYDKWKNDNFETSFNKNLVENYFTINEVDEKDQVKFRSKRYNYGFVLNTPFDITTKDGLRGFNYTFLNSFAKATNIEFNYKKYSSIDSLVKDFEANKLDIIFDYQAQDKYNMDVYRSNSIYNEQVVIIADQKTDLVINSVNSLTDQTVLTIKDSKIENYLKTHGVKTKTFNNVEALVNSLGENDLAAIDYYTYDCYVRSDLKTFKNLYLFKLDTDYDFISRDISANKTFNELFDFYISFINSKQMMNNSYKELLNYNNSNMLLKSLLTIFSAVLLVLVGIIAGKYIKRRKDHNAKLSKTDKLRYIDTLTSLKNRNYLNDNIPKWDSSGVYPQAIIIVDLNNIAYINDNFGHAEGDKVIVEGAGILINNQLEGSEIMRTNGNEFLVFMAEYDEKAVVTYIRKLHKELKKLSHGFGAAIGYSMIMDEIKTVDDAINEATLDMRNNKEDK